MDQLLFKVDYLLTQLSDLAVFLLFKFIFFFFNLLVLLGHFAEQLAHISKLVFVLKFLNLQFSILKPDIVFNQLSFPKLFLCLCLMGFRQQSLQLIRFILMPDCRRLLLTVGERELLSVLSLSRLLQSRGQVL